MIYYHGSSQMRDTLSKGTWVTDVLYVAHSFGKYVHVVEINDDDIDIDVIYSVVENMYLEHTRELRGTLLKDVIVKRIIGETR
jgi:predicted RNA-binding protein